MTYISYTPDSDFSKLFLILITLSMFTPVNIGKTRNVIPQKVISNTIDQTSITLTLIEKITLLENKQKKLMAVVHTATQGIYYYHRISLWYQHNDLLKEVSEISQDQGKPVLKVFTLKNKRLLYIKLISPSAGADWIQNILFLVTPGYTLIEVRGHNLKCKDFELPDISREAESYGGQVYDFSSKGLRFRSPVWCRGDNPNFPSGGVIEGTLCIVETVDSKEGTPLFELQVKKCRRILDPD